MSRSRCLFVLVCGGALALGACHVTAEPAEPVGEVEITSAPYDIETYPHTVYEGRTVYLYNGGWYYRDGGRWNRYRSEPAPLQQYRQRQYVQQAPPAPRSYPPGGYSTPGAYPNSAPPAQRTY